MTPLFEKFSSKENLKKAYEYIKFELKHATLSVDPFNYHSITAIDDIGEEFFDALENSLRSGKYIPEKSFFMYMSKDNLGIRPVCVLSTTDRIVYQALFNQEILGNKIDSKLSNKICFANRINDNTEDLSFLKYYLNGWNSFSKTQKKSFKKGMVWRVELDIQQYFEHIPIKRLVEVLKLDFKITDNSILEIFQNQLKTWVEYSNIEKGIPQGPNVSSLISNAYLASLDSYIHKEFDGSKIHYSRYADDIVLMGKTKDDVLNTIQKIVVFLRDLGLNLNEKTSLELLKDTKIIDAMRFADYSDNDIDLPEDDFSLIVKEVPVTLSCMLDGKKIDKNKLRELKFFLRSSYEYDFNLTCSLIDIIPIYPSLITSIIKYVSNSIMMSRFFSNKKGEDYQILERIWSVYSTSYLSEWSRFWIFKFLITIKNSSFVVRVEDEVNKIFISKDRSILKIISFYYKVINNLNIDENELIECIHEAKSNTEKSLFSFFLFNLSPEQINTSFIRTHIGEMIDNQSCELNLIGYFLIKNKFQTQLSEYKKSFSDYLLNKTILKDDVKYNYLVNNNDSFVSTINQELTEIMGVNRKKNNLVDLRIRSKVEWDKVLFEFKDVFNNVDIYYDNKYIGSYSPQEIGFNKNKKNNEFDREWRFLSAFSALGNEHLDKATLLFFTKNLAIGEKKVVSDNNVHSAKSKLSNKLKELFKTDKDPFCKFNGKYYQPVFKLKSDPEHRGVLLKRYGVISFNEEIDYTKN